MSPGFGRRSNAHRGAWKGAWRAPEVPRAGLDSRSGWSWRGEMADPAAPAAPPHPPRPMRLPLLDRLLRRLKGGERADLEAWEQKHRQTVRADLAEVLPHLPEAPVFIDAGANIGLFTEELLVRRPAARGYLFEPVAEVRARCAERFACDPRVRIVGCALSDHAGRATIYKARYNPGGNSLEADLMFDRRDVAEVEANPDHESEEVELLVFDDWVRGEGLERVDFIKTDCEGHDHAVLRGMLGFLEASEARPPILCELLRPDYHTAAAEQAEVLERLRALGYRVPDLAAMPDKVGDFLLLPGQR